MSLKLFKNLFKNSKRNQIKRLFSQVEVLKAENENQFVIYANKEIYFQSYQSVCAKVDENGDLTLYPDYDYSKTTSKHLYIFIDEFAKREIRVRVYNAKNKRKELAKMIKEGVVKYEELY